MRDTIEDLSGIGAGMAVTAIGGLVLAPSLGVALGVGLGVLYLAASVDRIVRR
jgi:hypothetical protein